MFSESQITRRNFERSIAYKRMNKKDNKIIFRADEETRHAFQELTEKHCLNVSAFLRKCLIDKHRELKKAEQNKC